jgi:hypothetical protein
LAWKVLWGIVSALLLITALWDFPEDVAGPAGFLISLGGEWFIRILALLLSFLLALVAIGPYRVQAWVRWAVKRQTNQPETPPATEPEAQGNVSPPVPVEVENPEASRATPESRSSDEELKQRTLDKSKELFQFSTERDSKDPTRTTWLADAGISGNDPGSKKRLNEHSQKGMNHFYETMDLYDQQFAGPVMALFDDLAGHGRVDPKEREKFQPEAPSEIRDIARRLSAIGHRMGKSMDQSGDEVLQEENEQLKVEIESPEEAAPSQEERKSRYEDLKQRCRGLADELRQFLEDHEKGTNEEEIMRLYRRQLLDKASALLEELEEQDLYPPKHLKSFELDANAYPRSPMAINRLAKTLGTIGHRR